MRIVLLRSTEVMPDPPVEKMADTLIGDGHEAVILAWDRGDAYPERESVKKLARFETKIIHFGIPAVYNGGIKTNLKPMAQFQARICRWLLQHHKEYDAVHAFDFDTGLTAMCCCRLLKKKFVYHILDYYVDGRTLPNKLLHAVIEYLEIRVINSADATILCTEKRREQIGKASPKRLEIIHNTPDAMLKPSDSFVLQSSRHRMKVAYVGILSEGRRLKGTVDIITKMGVAEMHIGGFGNYEDWMQKAADRYENIFFYGKLQYKDTLALESQCDIMIAAYDPSFRNHRYAAPNKFYEALMLGKPIIMARDTGYDDVIVENDIGVLTEFSLEGIREAIETLQARRAEWPEMGQRAMQLYKDRYSWETMKQRIAQLYRSL